MRSEVGGGGPAGPAASGGPLLLDGGVATELQRRGMSVFDPWWTSVALRTPEHRHVLREVHAGYVAAGVDVITANTFRTNLRALTRAGCTAAEAVELVAAAVSEARSAAAAADRPVRVAGSVAPVEDCYQPDQVPDDRTLRAEHAWHVAAMADAGVDLVLVETMNSAREAAIACAAASRHDLPVYASFVCGDGGRLLSGEPVTEAARRVREAGAAAVLVNCGTTARCADALAALAEAGSTPIGAYPNVEDRSGLPEDVPVDRYVPVRHDAGQFGDLVARWCARFDLAVVGGCCGTTPEHLTELAARLGRGLAGREAADRCSAGELAA